MRPGPSEITSRCGKDVLGPLSSAWATIEQAQAAATQMAATTFIELELLFITDGLMLTLERSIRKYR